jgi:hypothetical protein
MPEKLSVTLPGIVDKIIPSISPEKADTAQIIVESVDDLYRDVRIENTLTNESGGKVSLALGSPVKVTITARRRVPQRSKLTYVLRKTVRLIQGFSRR